MCYALRKFESHPDLCAQGVSRHRYTTNSQEDYNNDLSFLVASTQHCRVRHLFNHHEMASTPSDAHRKVNADEARERCFGHREEMFFAKTVLNGIHKLSDAMESMDSIESMEFMESMDSMETIESMESNDSMKSMKPIESCNGINGFHGCHGIHGFYRIHRFHGIHGYQKYIKRI